ncbi:MAG: F0F1 ATP synthase subunit epsilon [Bacteroidales bacterium]|jgi:F-type H+-transporting ATPase subunit epsilon|nr:F0F1 ATP synthase subunit epsilon [Bacteroidota bacterium]OQC03166.1 MAG: ATP synthase epsilon chain [Bacteroidetes bacterium ADurb.Bin090]HOD26308.1 F0F1 ATP synthase subunit epsilon [Bacteroidales bacterium]HQM92412.1 F0F1 ATP synthase subunit epsilon [Bacteroidales bacterium]
MYLEIITVEQKLFSGNVESVTVPGTMGPFTILKNHAPIVSSLTRGTVKYRSNQVENTLKISGGFIKANLGVVTICLTSSQLVR